MKKRPTRLRLKLNHITIEVYPLDRENDDGDTAGVFIGKKQILYINPEFSPAEQVRIFFHELVHAFYWAYNIDDIPMSEEKVCDLMESPLAALHCDNPHLSQAIAEAFAGKPLVVP